MALSDLNWHNNVKKKSSMQFGSYSKCTWWPNLHSEISHADLYICSTAPS